LQVLSVARASGRQLSKHTAAPLNIKHYKRDEAPIRMEQQSESPLRAGDEDLWETG
jgi:hypothetical protein